MEEPVVQAPHKKSKKQLIWALVCLIGPTALIVVSVLFYAIFNFIFASTTPTPTGEEELLGAAQSPIQTISNIALFLVGALAVITWLPGIVIGIILLANRK